MSGGLQEDLEVYQGVRIIAREAGWQLIPLRDRFESRLTELIRGKSVDGVIAPLISETWLKGLPRPWPEIVNLGNESELAGLCQVRVHAREVGRVAGEHLLSLGYDAFAYVGVPGSRTCHEYEAGFRTALEEGQLPFVCRMQSPGYLADEIRKWPEGTAVFCYSDFQARLLIREARKLGRAIPDDLAVCGVGNQELDQLAAGIGISTIPLPYELLGREAAMCLRGLLDGNVQPGSCVQLSPGAVLLRESTQVGEQDDPMVASAVQYLRRHVGVPQVSMEALAQHCGISRRGLEQKFKIKMGCAPYAQLLQFRMDIAKTLLRETGLRVQDVGERVGYPDPQRFSAFFKKHAGTSPGKWRTQQ